MIKLERDGKVISCEKSEISHSFYSHDADVDAKADGEIMIGTGYPLEQYFTQEAKRWDGRTGSRYQTFSKKGQIPVRDDFWIPVRTQGKTVYDLFYEQFENVTLADKTSFPYNWAQAWELPPECKTPPSALEKLQSETVQAATKGNFKVTEKKYGGKALPQIPTQWYGHRVVFDPDYENRDHMNLEGSYYYDGEKRRKASVFRFNDDEYTDRRGRELQIYDEASKSSTCYFLSYDTATKSWGNCTKTGGPGSTGSNCRWYDHNPEYPRARFDGIVTIGTGYPLVQFTTLEASRGQRGLGQRYQTFSEEKFVPVRDDYFAEDYFRYEQFENITLAGHSDSTMKRFNEAFEVPAACKKTELLK